MVHVQSVGRVRNMVILTVRIDVQCRCENLVALEAGALFIAFQSLVKVTLAVLGCVAFRFLLDALAFARNEYLVGTCLLFLTSRGEMASSHAGVATNAQLFATSLRTRLFAFSRTMALLTATVCAAR